MLNKIAKRLGYAKVQDVPELAKKLGYIQPEPKSVKSIPILLSNNYELPSDLHTSWCGNGDPYDDKTAKAWTPRSSLVVVNEKDKLIKKKELADMQIKAKQNNMFWHPHRFVNPMQDLDYQAIEALMSFTVGGAYMDNLTRFIMGTGFKPELQLKKPDQDPEKNEKKIEANQEIIDTLNEIDRQLEYDKDDAKDRNFKSKVATAIDAMNTYNRSALVFGYEDKIEIDGKTYPQIPSSLKFAHPRDLGIIEVTPEWRLKKVQWQSNFAYVEAKDMIYFWNELSAGKKHNAQWYGDSMVNRMLDNLRNIQKINGEDFPAMATNAWASSFNMYVKPEGQTETDRANEIAMLSKTMITGGQNIISTDPEHIKTEVVSLNPQVNQFVELVKEQNKQAIASLGLPYSLSYDESASNRATMLGKIQLTLSVIIEPLRAMIGEQLCTQWYQRWFRLIYGDKPEYKEFRIHIKWDDLKVEQFADRVEAVLSLDGARELKTEAMGKLLGIDNFTTMVDPDSEPIPGGNQKMTMSNNKGERLEMTKKKERL